MNNLAYSNFRNTNTVSRLTYDSTTMNQSNQNGTSPISHSMKSTKKNFSQHGQIESDAFTIHNAPVQHFSPKSIKKLRIVENDKSQSSPANLQPETKYENNHFLEMYTKTEL